MTKKLLLLFAAVTCCSIVNAQTTPACDRSCLEQWVDTYLVAMADADANPELFAPDVKFTEDGVRLPFGKEGLWFSASGVGNYKFYVPDTETQQIAFLGTVRENGTSGDDGDLVAIALRLQIRNNRITEIEQIVNRVTSVISSRGDFPPSGAGIEAMGAPHPVFTASIPENKSMSRAELITTADYYFSGMANNDGKGYYPFTDDCIRFENGVDVLGRSTPRATCKGQFETGLKGIVDRIRDRRYVAVDREKGIVFAFAFFDHNRINWTWQLGELFKIEKGQIRRIEAIFHRAPFGMNSGWSTYEAGISSEIQDVR